MREAVSTTSLAYSPDVLPPGLNITQVMIGFCAANLRYHILNGTHLSTGLVAHQVSPHTHPPLLGHRPAAGDRCC